MSFSYDNLHLGFLFYDFSDSRVIEVIQGISDRQSNDRISYFPAGPLNGPIEYAENNRKKVLDAIKSSSLDGLITLQFWESEAWFKSTLFDTVHFPVVPLLRIYNSTPGIVSSYSKGSYDIVLHLLTVHGCRKPYYLVGSTGKTASLDERFNGYKQALSDFGIRYSDDMKISLTGSFTTGGLVSGALHQGGSAVSELFIKQKLIPGRDIDSLVVFNDRMAIEVMDALAKIGIRVPEDIHLVSFDNTAESETASTPLTTSAIDWRALGSEGISLLRRIVSGNPLDKSIEILPKLIIRNSCGCSSAIDKLVSKNDSAKQQEVQQEILEDVFQDYRSTKEKLKLAADSARDTAILRNAAILLGKCNDQNSFTDTFTLLLNFLELTECSIYLADPYRKDFYNRHLYWSDNCQHYSFIGTSVNLFEINQHIGVYPITVCESLDQGDKHIGFLVFGAYNTSFTSFGELRDILSSLLHSLLLNENLKETQEQLLQKEKYSSLGRLVAGVAHEVNTPLGNGITASSLLVADVAAMKSKFESGGLSKQLFHEMLQSISESSTMIQNNLLRAGELIHSFKNVSINNMNDKFRFFSLRNELEDFIIMMTPQLRQHNLTISVDCEDSLELYSNPGILSQIFSNLISNSTIHGYPAHQGGNISITAEAFSPDEMLLTYKDDGIGMETSVVDKVFDPFFTTRPNSGGNGLGMFIVFNMVTQKLNGRIKIVSSPDNGVTIEIYHPIGNGVLS